MRQALARWGGKLLSIGGRVTLIRSTLANLPIYYLSLFKIPKGVVNEIRRIQSNFLWAGDGQNSSRGLALVNWDVIQAPKMLGGLGIGDILARNLSLLFKWVWRFQDEEKNLWRRVINEKYETDFSCNLVNMQIPRRGGPWKQICSSIKKIVQAFEIAKQGMRWKIGNGATTKFWSDTWIGDRPLKHVYPRLFSLVNNEDYSVASAGFWDGYNWHWVFQWRRELFEWEKELECQLVMKLQQVYLDETKPDELVWSFTNSGVFSTKSFYNELCSRVIVTQMPTFNGIWSGLVPHKVEVFLWLACLGRINSKKRLYDRGIIEDNELLCVLCEHEVEDHNHLFVHCNFSQQLWHSWLEQWSVRWSWMKNLADNFNAWKSPWGCKERNKIWVSGFFVIVWSIWKERNERIFRGKAKSVSEVIDLMWLRLGWWLKGWQENFVYTPDQVMRNPSCILWGQVHKNSKSMDRGQWEPPLNGCVKWNVDASMVTRDERTLLAIGGVLRNERSNIICLFYSPVNAEGINQAEYEAILKAIELSKSMCLNELREVVIESDSLNAVR